MRDDLEISRQEAAGATVHVIKDPVSSRFFRLKEKEYFIARQFDGHISADEVARQFQNRFGITIAADQIAAFAANLERLGLLESVGPAVPSRREERAKSLFAKFLFIKIKAINPERFIEKTHRAARPFYGRTALLIYLLFIIVASALTAVNLEELRQQAGYFFSAKIIPLAWITIFFVTVIHELSHTYSCRLGGGKVTDMGFLLLYLQPCFYSNISDAYLFPERRKRMAVTLAGIVSQIVIWAISVFIWRLTSQDNWVNSVAFIIIALSVIGIAFNLNPLLKLDGYYFLVDYWEIPNLRQKAFTFMRQKLVGIAAGETPLEASPREEKIFRYYGAASLLYSGSLIGYIAARLGRFIYYYSGGLGLLVLTIGIIYFALEAMQKARIFRILYDQRGEILKPNRLMIYGGVVLLIVLALILIRYPMRVTDDCVVLPLEQIYLRTSATPGMAELFIERANEEKSIKQFKLTNQDYSVMAILPALTAGSLVKKGDLIASINSNIYIPDSLDRYANMERARKQLDLLEKGPQKEEVKQTEDVIKQVKSRLDKSAIDFSRAESLYAIGGISSDELEGKKMAYQVLKSELDFYKNQLVLLKRGARSEQIEMARAQVDQLEAKVRHSDNQLEQTRIESPIDGVVTMTNFGSIVISIARTDTVKSRIYVPEKEISIVQPGNPVKMKARSYPALTYAGAVVRIDPVVTDEADEHRVIFVTANIANRDGMLKPGMTGKAKINCGNWPIYKIIMWRIVRYIRVEFWSWW